MAASSEWLAIAAHGFCATRSKLARRVGEHVVDADQVEDHLGAERHERLAGEQQMPERAVPVETGVVDPHLAELRPQADGEALRPGPAVAQVEALGGAAAHRHQRQPVREVVRRLGAAEAEGVLGVDDVGVELVGARPPGPPGCRRPCSPAAPAYCPASGSRSGLRARSTSSAPPRARPVLITMTRSLSIPRRGGPGCGSGTGVMKRSL